MTVKSELFLSYAFVYERDKGMVEAYCVKCKAKRQIKNPVMTTLKNGRKAVKGVCPVCGTKLFRIGGKL